MLLGRVLQVAPGRPAGAPGLAVGDRVATLVSLSLTPLRVDRVKAVRPASAQLDVDGEAVLFASGAYAKLPTDMPERLALAVLDVAGAAPQVARLVKPGAVVVVLGAGGKSGILCAAEARRRRGWRVRRRARGEPARTPTSCAPRPLRHGGRGRRARPGRRAQARSSGATTGREADVIFSCVNVADAEIGAILATRDRGIVYFFAMSTSFTKAALGAEGVGKDVDLFIGNGYAHGHADHTLAMIRDMPEVRALFERRYG